MKIIWPSASFALASAALFGASTPLAKLLVATTDPWLLAGLLYLGSGLGLSLVHIAQRALNARDTEAPLRRADLPWLIAVVLAGGVIGPVLLMYGLARIQASTAALLLNLEGLATLVIAWIIFRENVDRRILAGAFSILAGAALLSWQGGHSDFGWGALAIAAACLAWGIDNNLTRKLSAADPVQIAAVKGLAAGAVNLLLAFGRGAVMPATADVLGAGLIGFFGYGLSLALFVQALRRLGAARTGAYFSTAPFIGAGLAIIMFGEPLTLQLMLGGGLMALGVYLHLAERHAHEHVHDVMDHEHRHEHDAHHQHAHDQSDPACEPHSHRHRHAPLTHHHPHYPDLHHRHPH